MSLTVGATDAGKSFVVTFHANPAFLFLRVSCHFTARAALSSRSEFGMSVGRSLWNPESVLMGASGSIDGMGLDGAG
jgi:hypothetical protein